MRRLLRRVLWAAFLVLLVATGLHFYPLLREGLSSSTRFASAMTQIRATREAVLAGEGGVRGELDRRLAAARASTLDQVLDRRSEVQARLDADRAARRPEWRRKAAFLTGDGLAQDVAREVRLQAGTIELGYLDALVSRLLPATQRATRLRQLYVAQMAAWERLSSGHRVICPVGDVPWYDFSYSRSWIEDCRAYAQARQAYVDERARDAPLVLPDLPSTDGLLRPVLDSLETAAAQIDRQWAGNPVARHLAGIRSQLPAALLWLVSAMAVTLGLIVGVRAFFYFIVAPWVSRRRPVLLLPGAQGPSLPDRGRVSDVSQEVIVAPEEELLVHPRFLQSADMAARMRTRWLLSWRFPIASLASHLFALTRIRTDTPRTFVISATEHDAVSEIGALRLAEGDALVLQPRCLVGVLQRQDRPMRITRHWRLFTLNAWLTLQLRYLVFRGPATLLIKGARGVRLETADSARAISQAATLGFGANVAYSQVRTETFFPYVSGRLALFNDRFTGPGVYLYEETTGYGGHGRGPAGRHLEGFLDALLKILGI